MLKTVSPQLTHYRKFADSIRQPIAVIDEDFTIFIFNDSFRGLCNYSDSDIEGKDLFGVICDAASREQMQTDLVSKSDSGNEFEYCHPDAPARKFMLSANSFFPDEDPNHFRVLFFREITLEKIDEQRRDDFISIASHELKTPIAIISAYSQIIEKEAKDNTSAVLRIYASKINQQSKKLVSLSSTLLDISAIQTGKITLQISTFDLNDILHELAENFSYTNKTHAIHLETDSSLIVAADRQKITQVLNNLISNAIKYSPNADKISIKASKSNQNILVSISDHGIGIPEEEKDKLFRRFSRTDLGTQQNIQGSGLGLYICSEIIRKHNGRLSLESKKGVGSTFHISIPEICSELC